MQKKKSKWKNSLMTQTMHLALFGPIFITTTPPVVYFIDYNYIYIVSFKKMKKGEEKNSLMAQTMPDVLFGPSFITAAPPITYFIHYNYIDYKC